MKIGGRIWKTVLAVFLCFGIDTMRKTGVPFYAAIAAILCMQRSHQDSLWQAKNREIATIIGGIWGMLFLLFERYVVAVPVKLLRYVVLSLLLIPIIKLVGLDASGEGDLSHVRGLPVRDRHPSGRR